MNNRFVAHFDILGMSALIRHDPELAWEKLSALSTAREERLTLDIERLDTGEVIQDQVRAVVFSDTIVIFSKSDTDDDILAMITLTTELFAGCMYHRVPLRGAIAHGPFNFNFQHSLYLGPALLDAYELGESSQWLGISVDEAVAEAAARLPTAVSPRGKPMIVPWPVPCKNGAVEQRLVVNWPESHRKSYQRAIPLTAKELYENFFSEAFGSFEQLDTAVRMKYENTVDFFNKYFEP